MNFRGELPGASSIQEYHNLQCDFVVNTALRSFSPITLWLQIFASGIPSTWELYLPHKERELRNLFVDNRSRPHYIAKIRRPLSIQPQRHINSLAHELILASAVSNALRTDEAQEMARRLGFANIQFVEPLFGVIKRLERQKTMVYPWVPRAEFVLQDKSSLLVDHFEQIEPELVEQCEGLFMDRGISTWDLGGHQFLMNQDARGRHLYLIDIEGFSINKY